MTDREWRITLGLCTCCGKERPVRGHRYCPECQEKGREKYYAQRRRHPERYKEYACRAAEKRRERKAAGNMHHVRPARYAWPVLPKT